MADLTVISLRVVRGLVGVAAALAVIAAVGLVAPPPVGVAPLSTTVEPQPADLLAACPGALQRLGDDTGANAGQASAVGVPDVVVASSGGAVERTPLAGGDGASGSAPQAPLALRMPPSADAVLGGAQTQSLAGQAGLRGLAAIACAEPVSSAWLVGGTTTVGRTTLLLLANPTAVAADVTVRMWGESGAIAAPGMSGITVPPGGQRTIPLAGYAPDLASPIVHVESRGGQVVAALQTSVVRVLDPGGVDLVSAGAAPARETVVPGVRIFDAEGVASSLGIEGHDDLEAIARIGNPGDGEAHVEVSVASADGGAGTSFMVEVPAGQVSDVALAAALELGSEPFPDGSYTVSFRSDQPIVAGVRVSTIPVPTEDGEGGLVPGPADLAWFASAPKLRGTVAVPVVDGPEPVLVVANPDDAARTVTLTPPGGGPQLTATVPARASVAIPLAGGAGYLLGDADGLRAGLGFAGPGELAGYPLVAPRAADSALVVRP